jgi:hypothetical protein
MIRRTMADKVLEELYKVKEFNTSQLENPLSIGRITEKERFIAAKQILLGLAVLYVLTLAAYLVRPTEGGKLVDICTTTFPPLATIILVSYFRDKVH